MFGELEFWFSSIKVLALIGLILMGILSLASAPLPCHLNISQVSSLISEAILNTTECRRFCLSSYLALDLIHHLRSGFRYWDPPDGPLGEYLNQQIPNRKSLTTFLGFWTTLINALFAYMGTELIGVTVGEAQNPRKNIPIAIKRTFWRILIFYIGGVFVIGLIVPRTDPTLFVANTKKTGAAASPFVVATTLVGIKTLNHVVNGAILVFVLSAANSDLYIGSRTLYGLAVEGKTPAVFRRVSRMGVPYPALILCTAFCFLVFLNVSSSSQKGDVSQYSPSHPGPQFHP